MDTDPVDDDDDIQFIKMEPKKKALSWVSSSFGEFDLTSHHKSKVCNNTQTRNLTAKAVFTASQSLISAFTSESQSRKRPRRFMEKKITQMNSVRSWIPEKVELSSELWSEKYQPLLRSDLAVHKKKVDEVADWFKLKSSYASKHAAPILLLTGPPGAGKTACVRVLCSEMGLDMREWSSSQELSASQWSKEDFRSSDVSKMDVYTSQSQSSAFQNFLLRANKYQPIQLFSSSMMTSKRNSEIATDRENINARGSTGVIVVEDIPNIFFRDTTQFHGILRKYHRHGHCPLVFIMSESNTNSSSTQKLFPQDLQQQLKICNISVNPVAPTVLTKILNRVVNQESVRAKLNSPDMSVLESIAMSSNGDVRSALNALQFAYRTDTTDLKALCKITAPSLRKRQSTGSRLKNGQSRKMEHENSHMDNSSGTIGAKDKTMFLFHALGKILYFKRGDSKEYPNHPKLPEHLKDFDRDPLLLDPEEVASKSHLSGDYFNSFLHENYVEFLSSVEDLERASEYFSDSDYFSSVWVAREELRNFSVSVATRGFIHSNSDICLHNSLRKNHGWRPLHKSQWFNIRKQADENVTSARQTFKGYHWEPEMLCTEIIPYISLTNPTLHDTGQITFVQEMTQFYALKQTCKSNAERLDEKDLGADDAEDSPENSKESDLKAVQFFSGAQINTQEEENVDEDNFAPSSQTKIHTVEEEDKDDFLIEDFDDEF